jgi:hypothetical protein
VYLLEGNTNERWLKLTERTAINGHRAALTSLHKRRLVVVKQQPKAAVAPAMHVKKPDRDRSG